MAAKKKPHQVIGYRLYQFGGDHDPVIDIIRTAMEDKAITLADLHKTSDVSASTLTNWFSGKTKRPQHATIKTVVRALGPEYDYEMTKNGRSIRGRKR